MLSGSLWVEQGGILDPEEAVRANREAGCRTPGPGRCEGRPEGDSPTGDDLASGNQRPRTHPVPGAASAMATTPATLSPRRADRAPTAVLTMTERPRSRSG